MLSSSRRIVEDLPSRGWVLRGCFRPPLRPSISILVRFLRFAGGAGCWGSYHPDAVMLVHLPVLICESSFESSSVSRSMQPQWTGHFISPATGTPYPQAPSLGSTVWLPGGQTLFIFFARSERHGVSARRYERCRNGASQKEAWHWHAGRLTGTRGCPDDLVERTSPCPLIHRSTCHSTASRSGLV